MGDSRPSSPNPELPRSRRDSDPEKFKKGRSRSRSPENSTKKDVSDSRNVEKANGVTGWDPNLLEIVQKIVNEVTQAKDSLVTNGDKKDQLLSLAARYDHYFWEIDSKVPAPHDHPKKMMREFMRTKFVDYAQEIRNLYQDNQTIIVSDLSDDRSRDISKEELINSILNKQKIVLREISHNSLQEYPLNFDHNRLKSLVTYVPVTADLDRHDLAWKLKDEDDIGLYTAESKDARKKSEIMRTGGTLTIQSLWELAANMLKHANWFYKKAHDSIVSQMYLQNVEEQNSSYKESDVSLLKEYVDICYSVLKIIRFEAFIRYNIASNENIVSNAWSSAKEIADSQKEMGEDFDDSFIDPDVQKYLHDIEWFNWLNDPTYHHPSSDLESRARLTKRDLHQVAQYAQFLKDKGIADRQQEANDPEARQKAKEFFGKDL